MLTGTGCVVTGAPVGASPRSSGARTNSESCFVSLFGEPFAWTVKVKVPLCVGVPVMTPFVPRVNPGGSVPPARVQELAVPPCTVNAGAVYAWPRFASGRLLVATKRRTTCGVDVEDEPVVRRVLEGAGWLLVVPDLEVEGVATRRCRCPADDPLVGDGQSRRERARRDVERGAIEVLSAPSVGRGEVDRHRVGLPSRPRGAEGRILSDAAHLGFVEVPGNRAGGEGRAREAYERKGEDE